MLKSGSGRTGAGAGARRVTRHRRDTLSDSAEAPAAPRDPRSPRPPARDPRPAARPVSTRRRTTNTSNPGSAAYSLARLPLAMRLITFTSESRIVVHPRLLIARAGFYQSVFE